MRKQRTWTICAHFIALLLAASGLRADTAPVDLSPNNLNLGSEIVGATSGPGAVTVTNHLAVSVTIFSVTTTGDFAQSNNCGPTLAPGHSCTVKVTFTPTVVGARTGQLLINDDAATSPQVTSLSGTGSVSGLASISLSPVNPSIPLGLKQQFAATGLFKNGTVADLTTSVSWSSSNPAVAAISNSTGSQGQTTSLAQGTTAITASLGMVSGSTIVTVTPPALVSLAIAPANPSIPLGVSQQFSAIGTFTNGDTQDLTASVIWNSSNAKVATFNNQGKATSLAQGTTTITASLGAVSGSTILTVTAPALVSLAVTPPNASIQVGAMQQFSAIGTFTNGGTQDLTTSVVWNSSNKAVAAISQGWAKGIALGMTTISAVDGALSASTQLTVAPPPVLVSISLSPTNPSLPMGLKQQFAATGLFDNGTVKDITSSVDWNSSNQIVATINSQGLATSWDSGTTMITASLWPVSGSTTLTVVLVPKSLDISPFNPMIPLGVSQQFSVFGFFTNGDVRDVTAFVAWNSSNPAVATINSQGKATSLAEGTTVITASLNGVSGSTVLTVDQPIPASLAVTPSNPSIPPGATQQFGVIATLTNGDTQDVTRFMAWNSSNTAVAIINRLGVAKALTTGTTTISASFSGMSASAQLTVAMPQGLVSIHVLPANGSIPLTTALQFRAIATFDDGSQGDLTSSVSWNSSDPTVAAISNSAGSEGLAVPVAAGTTTISASTGPYSDSTGVSVTALVPGQARFAYVTNFLDATVSIYLIDGISGQLTPTGSTLFDTQMSYPDAVVADPTCKFLYAADRGNFEQLFAYTIDPTTGFLAPIGSPVDAQVPWALAMHPSGKFLFMANGPGTISTYSINATGAATLAGQAPTAPGGATSVAVDPSGRFVYAANWNGNTISGFSVDSSTGLLAPIPGSPFAAGANPSFVAVHPSGNFLYAANVNGSNVSAFAVDSNTGALTGIPGSPFTVGFGPEAIALDPAGEYAYVANSGANNVSALTIESATGVLQPIAGSPSPAGSDPNWAIVDPLGKFLYIVNFSSNNISVFAIDPATGSLTSLGTVTTGAGPISMALVK